MVKVTAGELVFCEGLLMHVCKMFPMNLELFSNWFKLWGWTCSCWKSFYVSLSHLYGFSLFLSQSARNIHECLSDGWTSCSQLVYSRFLLWKLANAVINDWFSWYSIAGWASEANSVQWACCRWFFAENKHAAGCQVCSLPCFWGRLL